MTDLADLFDHCGDALPGMSRAASAAEGRTCTNPLANAAPRLLGLLGAEPAHREFLGRALDIGAADLAVLLGELELAGSVRSLAGGFVSRQW